MAFDAVNAALILSKGVGCPPNDMQSFSATSQEDGIKVTFTGPKNSYIFGAANNDTLLSTPAGVMIRYSDTDYPADINDGTLLGVYNEDYNPVNPTEVTDNLIGLVFEQTYYFSAFPFSVDGIYNKSQAPANRASCQWVGNKGTINVTVQAYEGYLGTIGEYTITLVDQAESDPQNITKQASGTGLTQIGNLEAGKTYVVTLTDTNNLTSDPSDPITIVAGTSYNVTMTYREKYGSISVNVQTASDFATLGEYTITLLDQAADSPSNVEKQATGKGVTTFDNLISGKQYKVRLGATANFIPPADSDVITVVGGETESITMTYAAGMGSVVINVSTNPTGMPIGSYTISLVPTAGGSTLQQSGSGSQAVTFNNVPIGTYNVKGSSINHYTFNANGSLSVTGGQQSSHNVVYRYSASLNDSSWAEIQAIARSGQAASFFSVGDEKNGVTGIKNVLDYDFRERLFEESSAGTSSYTVAIMHINYNDGKNIIFCTKGYPLSYLGGIYVDSNGWQDTWTSMKKYLSGIGVKVFPDAYNYMKSTNIRFRKIRYKEGLQWGEVENFNESVKIWIPTRENVDSKYVYGFSYFSSDQRRQLTSTPTKWRTSSAMMITQSSLPSGLWCAMVDKDGYIIDTGTWNSTTRAPAPADGSYSPEGSGLKYPSPLCFCIG